MSYCVDVAEVGSSARACSCYVVKSLAPVGLSVRMTVFGNQEFHAPRGAYLTGVACRSCLLAPVMVATWDRYLGTDSGCEDKEG